MKWAAICLILLTACSDIPKHISQARHGLARITLYNKHEDKYGNRIASSRTRRARVAETVAAESSYPFGTRVYFPDLAGVIGDGVFTVEDRGSAVERRTASYGQYPVFDIYAGSKKQMRQWVKRIPDYLPFHQF